MKKGFISDYGFNHFDEERFSDNKYVLVVKDEDYPDRNVVPILFRDCQSIQDLDENHFSNNIIATPNLKMPEIPSLGERFLLNQILKISTGNIISNNRWTEGSRYPKVLTFHTNINSLAINEIVEIFRGDLDERKGKFKNVEPVFNQLFEDLYLDSQNCFFVEREDCFIGPFIATKKASDGSFLIEKSNWFHFGRYSYANESYVEFDANGLDRKIILPGINKLHLIDKIDFITDEQIVDQFISELDRINISYNADRLKEFKQLIEHSLNIIDINKYPERNIRLLDVLRKSNCLIESNLDLVKLVPDLEIVKDEVASLKIEKSNLSVVCHQLEEQIENLTYEQDNKKREIENLKQDIENINEIKGKELLNEKHELEAEVAKLESRRQNIAEEIEVEKKQLSKKLAELKTEIEEHENHQNTLLYLIKKNKAEYSEAKNNTENALAQIIQHKNYQDLINARNRDFDNFKIEDEISYVDQTVEIEDDIRDYKTLRNNICSVFELQNRKLETHFIDNLLISIHQNTLTLFAGIPGCGKTTLARIITNALAPKNRIREVAVGRGWTTQKDLIGFMNPLNGQFHASSTDIYSLLKQIDYEYKEDKYKTSPLSYVILDEANLSPMEHYWSIFYNLTDLIAQKNRPIKISLGGGEEINYPNNLRFIGTINYDQTTEELSPRVVDRANIIRIAPRQFVVNTLAQSEIETLSISFAKCLEMFKLMDLSSEQIDYSFDDNTDVVFKEIKQIFEQLRIVISPRVEISIKKYCYVARQVMTDESKPLDYSIAQRVLPLINVQGEKSRNILNKLLVYFKDKGMLVSYRLLELIINLGSEGEMYEDNYNYFLTLSHV